MGSATRGNEAEAAVLLSCVKRGWDVLVPFGSGQAFDMAIYVPDVGFLRVQCKRGWQVKGCVVFNAYGTDHGSGPRSYSGLADVLAVYFPPHDQVFLIPVDGHPVSKGGLRLEPARNNQRKGIRFAVDFEIGRWTEERLAMLAPATRSPAA